MSSSREETAKKKKDVWEEAAGEFYTESYPSGSKDSNNTNHRRPSRLALPLPSHTARRGSLLQGRRTKTGGRKNKHSLANNTGTRGRLTYTSTMAIGDANGTTTNANDIQVAILPDLSEETILNERKTWEELLRIKSMPVPMAQKKQLKAQLVNLPKLRLKGWSHLKYSSRKSWKNFMLGILHLRRSLIFLGGSLRTIELRSGTAIANVFLFIKWTILLNFAMSIGMFFFIILPYIVYDQSQGGHMPSSSDASTCLPTIQSRPVPDDTWNDTEVLKFQRTFTDCCRAVYERDAKDFYNPKLHSIVSRTVYNVFNTSIREWVVHYSYYEEPKLEFNGGKYVYRFDVAYVLTGCAILICSLILLVYNMAAGVKEIIRLKEGEFYKYSNLVFSGWEHFTNDGKGADFKRRMIRNEMRAALHIEKKKITDTGLTRKERIKLLCMRLFVNVIVIGMLISAAIIIFHMSLAFSGLKDRQLKNNAAAATTTGGNSTDEVSNSKFEALMKEFSTSFVISFFNLIFPLFLTRLGKLEELSREWEMGLVLLRSLFIRIFSVCALALAYYKWTYCIPEDNDCVKCNHTASLLSGVSETIFEFNETAAEEEERIDDRTQCWEVEFASQIYKLVITELLIKVVVTFIGDPSRRLIGYCCKNRVGKRIGRLNFNIVRHSLDIIYIQVLSWISFHFAPFMPLVTVAYCFLIFYIKKFGVIHNVNFVPETFRTTRTTAVFMMAKIISFVVVLFTYAFIVGFMVPSRECGPFRGQPTAWSAVKEQFKDTVVPDIAETIFPGIAVPAALVMILVAYYYYSVAQANRSMVETLRHLLILEGHDKQYLFSKLNSLRHTGKSTEVGSRKSKKMSEIFADPPMATRKGRITMK